MTRCSVCHKNPCGESQACVDSREAVRAAKAAEDAATAAGDEAEAVGSHSGLESTDSVAPVPISELTPTEQLRMKGMVASGAVGCVFILNTAALLLNGADWWERVLLLYPAQSVLEPSTALFAACACPRPAPAEAGSSGRARPRRRRSASRRPRARRAPVRSAGSTPRSRSTPSASRPPSSSARTCLLFRLLVLFVVFCVFF